MSAAPVTKIYDAIKAVLVGAAELPASLVPENNIRPGEDPSEPEAGNMIFYSLTGTRWDRKRRRGEGVLSVSVASVGNNVKSGEIMDIIRGLLTPKALTDASSDLRVHMMKESEDYSDTGTTTSDRWLAATSFDWKLVEAA